MLACGIPEEDVRVHLHRLTFEISNLSQTNARSVETQCSRAKIPLGFLPSQAENDFSGKWEKRTGIRDFRHHGNLPIASAVIRKVVKETLVLFLPGLWWVSSCGAKTAQSRLS